MSDKPCSTEGCAAPAEGMDGRCWPCTQVEIARRDAALRAQYPNVGRPTKGLRTRGFGR